MLRRRSKQRRCQTPKDPVSDTWTRIRGRLSGVASLAPRPHHRALRRAFARAMLEAAGDAGAPPPDEPEATERRRDGGADEHEPQSESEVADLDARLTGMSMLLRMTVRFMKS